MCIRDSYYWTCIFCQLNFSLYAHNWLSVAALFYVLGCNLPIFLELGLALLLQYAFLCHGSVCVQVLPSNSLGLAALSTTSSCSSYLLLPSWVQCQVVYSECLRQWMSFFLHFFMTNCLRQCITFLFTVVLSVQHCILYIFERIWHIIKSSFVAKQFRGLLLYSTFENTLLNDFVGSPGTILDLVHQVF